MARKIKKISGSDIINAYQKDNLKTAEEINSTAKEYTKEERKSKISGSDIMNSYQKQYGTTPAEINRAGAQRAASEAMNYALEKAMSTTRAALGKPIKIESERKKYEIPKYNQTMRDVGVSEEEYNRIVNAQKEIGEKRNDTGTVSGNMLINQTSKTRDLLVNQQGQRSFEEWNLEHMSVDDINRCITSKKDAIRKRDNLKNALGANYDAYKKGNVYVKEIETDAKRAEEQTSELKKRAEEQASELKFEKTQKLTEKYYSKLKASYDKLDASQVEVVKDLKEAEKYHWDNQTKDGYSILKAAGFSDEDISNVVDYQTHLDNVASTNDYRDKKNQEMQESGGAEAAARGVGNSASSLAYNAFSPLDALEQARVSIHNAVSGDEDYIPYDTNSAFFSNRRNALRESVNNKIDNEVGQFAYNTAMSMGDSAIALATGNKKAAIALMSTQAGTRTYIDSTERGLDTSHAALTAIAAGCAEAITEKVSIESLFHQIDAAKAGSVGAKQTIKNVLQQSFVEGSEEVGSDVLNYMTDALINGDQSEYEQTVRYYVNSGMDENEARKRAEKEWMVNAAQDFAGGALSGGVFAGAGTAYGNSQYKKLGAHINTNENLKQSVVKAAGQMDDNATAKQIVESKKTEELTDTEWGTVIKSMSEVANTDVSTVIKNRFVDLGESEQQAKHDTEEIMKAITISSSDIGTVESDERLARFEQNDNLPRVYGETLRSKEITAANALSDVQDSYEMKRILMQKGKSGKTGVTRAVSNVTGKPVIVVDIHSIDDKGATVRLSDGSVTDIAKVTMPETMQKLYNYATTMDTPKAANALIENYNNEPLTTYLEAGSVFYNMGKLGTNTYEQVVNNPKNARLIAGISNESVLKQMYDLGQNTLAAKEAVPQQSASVKKGTGKVADSRTYRADTRIADIAKVVSEKLGVDITLNDTLANGENGHFAKAVSRIALSSTSKNEYATLVHEINEFADVYNPQGMKRVMDTVLSYAGTKEGATYLTKRIGTYQDAYRRVEADKSYQDASEEFVFDYLAGVFSTKEGVAEFVEYMTDNDVPQEEQKGILQTIADFLKGIMDKINSYLSEHVLSETSKKGLQADADKAAEIRSMVLDAWEQARVNYESGVNAEGDFSEQSEAKFSVSVDEDGIENYNTSDETKKLSYAERKKKLMSIMTNQYAGRTAKFEKEGNTYYALYDRDGIRKGTYGDKKSDAKGYQAKINIGADGNYIELAEKAQYMNSSKEVGKETRFHKNAKEWDYYIKTIRSDGRYFDVLINVKDTGDNKYVYDITLKEADSLPDSQGSYDGSLTASMDSIPSDNSIVNAPKKYSIDVDNFKKAYDNWDKKNLNINFKLGRTPKALLSLGYASRPITMDSSKIIKIRSKHKGMTDSIIKKIPFIVNDPIVVLESLQDSSRLVLANEIQDGSGKTVVAILELNPTDRKGLKIEDIKIASAYGKDSFQNMLNKSNIKYLSKDKNRTNSWLKSTRLQLPVKSTTIDSKNSIPSDNSIVNAPKKYSIDIDEDFFNLMEKYSEEEQKAASIIQEGFEAMKNVTVDKKIMHQIAYQIRKEYQSTYNLGQFEDNLQKVFAYLKDTQNVSYEDMVRIVQEIAKPVIEQSTDVNQMEKENYQAFKKMLKDYKIKLSDEQKKEAAYHHGTYDKFRKLNIGTVTFSEQGQYLDSLWSEICDNSFGMLDEDISPADQPIALIDAINTLKPSQRNIYGMDSESMAYDMALDIYRRFFVEQAKDAANVKVHQKTLRLIDQQQSYRRKVKEAYTERYRILRENEVGKRKRLAEQYEERIKEIQQDKRSALYYKDAMAAHELERKINRYQYKLAKTKADSNEKILRLKASYTQNNLNRKRNQELSTIRERIKKNAISIVSSYNTNTDKKHVPEGLKDAVAGFVTSLNFTTNRTDENSNAQLAWEASLNKLQRRLQLWEEDKGDEYRVQKEETEHLLEKILAFVDSNSGIRISDMNIYQLKQLDDITCSLKGAINEENRLYVNKRTNNVQKLGNGTIRELERKRDKKQHGSLTEALIGPVDSLMNVQMLDARSFFYRLGENASSIYDGLRDGLSERVWMFKEAQEYMQQSMAGIDNQEIGTWTGDKAKIHEFMIQGQELKLTTAQMMSLYELDKRRQAKVHIRVGGIRPTDMKTVKERIHRVTPLKLSDYEVKRICDKLTDEQKRIADTMQQFMSKNCAEWGNKTSMKMYGYKRFGAENYFPIRTDDNSVDTKDKSKYWGAKNQGFTKETKKKAGNTLVIDDIFNVFTNHVTDMATYASFTAPLADAMQWFNYRQVESQGDTVEYGKSVKTELERTYGKDTIKYFEKLIQDINAQTSKDMASKPMDVLISNMKIASVGANIRVAIQQPTAYIRATAVMNPKYLAKAFCSKSAVKKARENSAITQWKSWGYFETSIGQSMKGIITGQQSFKDNITEKSMILAQLGDDFTWGYLWNACEAEIKDKHPDVKYDSKEFIELTTRRFDDVIDQTQVVDSVLHRSHIMRGNGIEKLTTSFMSEPTKTYNLLMNAVRDVKENKPASRKKLIRVVIVYVMTNLINAAAQSVIDAMRDLDDDDDKYGQRWIDAYKENAKDNMNPLDMIPYVKDVISIFSGYSVDRMDMEGINNLVDGAKSLYKYQSDEKYRKNHTELYVVKNLARGLSQVTGIPVYNVLRDLESVYHTVTDEYMGGISRTNTRQYQRMLDALKTKDNVGYNEIREELHADDVEDKTINSGIRTKVKEEYLSGEISKTDASEIMKNDLDMTDDEVYFQFDEWAGNNKYDTLYSTISHANETGRIDDRDAIFKEIENLKSHGVTEEDLKGRVSTEYRPKYLEQKKKGKTADMKNLLISVYLKLGDTRDKAIKKIDNWK